MTMQDPFQSRTRAVATVVLLPLLVAALPALAFHDGGVADCSGCHTMHNSSDGAPVDAENPAGNDYLLKAGNATDTCLVCHALRNGEGYSPGGDFYWLTRTFSWNAHGSTAVSTGDSHGHNVVSGVHGIEADAIHAVAPGGTFESRQLGCTSCHDPHGNQGFRMLWGAGEGPLLDSGRLAFTEPRPEAVSIGAYNSTPGSSGEETNAGHTVYKDGMSAWCTNCHQDMERGHTSDFRHPAGDPMGATTAALYNAYVSTADPTGGDPATAWMGLVPFEAVSVDLDAVDPWNYTDGPLPEDQVMCLSCHRAHASAFADAGRWDFAATYLGEESHPAIGDEGASLEDVVNRYYSYTFVDGQRSLCNKCHVKDLGDALPPTIGPPGHRRPVGEP
jgi:hypothetical protein